MGEKQLFVTNFTTDKNKILTVLRATNVEHNERMNEKERKKKFLRNFISTLERSSAAVDTRCKYLCVRYPKAI